MEISPIATAAPLPVGWNRAVMASGNAAKPAMMATPTRKTAVLPVVGSNFAAMASGRPDWVKSVMTATISILMAVRRRVSVPASAPTYNVKPASTRLAPIAGRIAAVAAAAQDRANKLPS